MQALWITGGANYTQQVFIEHLLCARNYARLVLDTEWARTDAIPNLKCKISSYQDNVCYEGKRLCDRAAKRHNLV